MTEPVMTLEEGRAMTVARAMGLCEVQVAPDCRMSPVDHHHRQRRGLGDHRPSNGIAGCRPCHGWIHAHPEASLAYGFIVATWADPAAEPALLHPRGEYLSRLVHLTEGGTYL